MIEASNRKSVTFAEEKNTSHVYYALATDVLWEWPEFFEQSRKTARSDGRRLRKEGADRLIENCFRNCRTDIQKCLNEFAKLGHGRGIERFISREMYDERRQERSDAIQAILIGQKQAREKGLPQDVAKEQLREVSLIYCLHAKVFARRLGKADETACYPKMKSITGASSRGISSTKGACSSMRSTATRAA